MLTAVGVWFAAGVGHPATPGAFQMLGDEDITRTLSGQRVTDDHHWTHHYLADGRVMLQESGPQRLGQWSVRKGQLCLVNPRISKAWPVCYGVQGRGTELRYLDGQQVVYQGFVRGPADASLFKAGAKH